MAVIQSYMDSLLVPIVLVSNDYEVAGCGQCQTPLPNLDTRILSFL